MPRPTRRGLLTHLRHLHSRLGMKKTRSRYHGMAEQEQVFTRRAIVRPCRRVHRNSIGLLSC